MSENSEDFYEEDEPDIEVIFFNGAKLETTAPQGATVVHREGVLDADGRIMFDPPVNLTRGQSLIVHVKRGKREQ